MFCLLLRLGLDNYADALTVDTRPFLFRAGRSLRMRLHVVVGVSVCVCVCACVCVLAYMLRTSSSK